MSKPAAFAAGFFFIREGFAAPASIFRSRSCMSAGTPPAFPTMTKETISFHLPDSAARVYNTEYYRRAFDGIMVSGLHDRASIPKTLAPGTLACGLLQRSTGFSPRFDPAAQSTAVSTFALSGESNLNRWAVLLSYRSTR
jgi:hypothetical protein